MPFLYAFFPRADLSATTLHQYEDTVNAQADLNGIDPWLVAAVIMVESSGDPNAVNKTSKATGLMQVMPFEAGDVFSGRPTIEELKDPDTNIAWGCRILGDGLLLTHSECGALYRYSGGKYWESIELYTSAYWKKVVKAREELKAK